MTFTPAYDAFGRMTRSQTAHGGSDIVNFAYTYDSNSNIISQQFVHRNGSPYNTYTYDALDRLTRSDYHDSENEQFTYDALGNRLTLNNRAGNDVAYLHNIANEYTAVGGNAVTHDDAGNMTVDDNGYQYSYDYENRLAGVQNEAQYTYDALGRRIEFIDSEAGVTKRYYYDGWRVLSETDEDGDLVYSYVYGNNLDEVLMRETWAGLADYYYVHDHLFSPVAIISDGLDAVVERYEYDAYGKCNIWDATFANSRSVSSFGNVIAFTGQRLDSLDNGNLLIMYYKNRIYVIALGRFAQRDPIGIKDEMSLFEFAASGNPKLPRKFEPERQYTNGMCLYEYVKSNPTNHFDQNGLELVSVCIRPLNMGPLKHTWITVHCFIRGCNGEWNFNKKGVGAEPDPEGVGGNAPKCVTVRCCDDICKKILNSRIENKEWSGSSYKFFRRNCCHWVDWILKSSGCRRAKKVGIEDLFPGYSLPTHSSYN